MKNVIRKKGYIIFVLIGVTAVFADSAQAQFAETSASSAYLIVGGEGFMSLKDSYKVNYETRTFALPMMFHIGMMFPANERVSFGAILRYISRDAVFVEKMSISTLELYPAVSYFLEEPEPNEVRIVGRIGLCFIRSLASGELIVSSTGDDDGRLTAEKSYYNIGMGIDLGMEYPVSQTVAISAGLHAASYFSDAIRTGGLGNLGGVSIGAGVLIGL